MEWVFLISWLGIINGALGGQYLLNWMGNQERFAGKAETTPGVMTWWREVSKLLWALIAVTIEIARGKELKYFWPGMLSMVTIGICAFTGVIENIGFFYLPRYYSPHVYAPYVNIYLVFLPFFGKLLFKAPIRKEHWIGVSLVVLGLVIGKLGQSNAKSQFDLSAMVWILIINLCLGSQQILNNKTVQTAFQGVGANALVAWREVWKLVFITLAIIIFPIIAQSFKVHTPDKIAVEQFENSVIKNQKLDTLNVATLHKFYSKQNDQYVLQSNISVDEETQIKNVFIKMDYNRFFSLFEGKLFPNNWIPILFVVAAGLTGYIYSLGFFKLSKFAAHFWVPYTNVYFAILPFIMILFGEHVTSFQIGGAAVLTVGLIVGVSDYGKNKVVEIENINK